jgi:hypothetical protein
MDGPLYAQTEDRLLIKEVEFAHAEQFFPYQSGLPRFCCPGLPNETKPPQYEACVTLNRSRRASSWAKADRRKVCAFPAPAFSLP